MTDCADDADDDAAAAPDPLEAMQMSMSLVWCIAPEHAMTFARTVTPYVHAKAARQAGGSGVDTMTDEQLHAFLKTARRR